MLGALLWLAGGRLAAQGIAYDGSLSASTGDYFFTEPTSSVVLTNSLAVRAGRFTFRGTLPVWWQNTTLLTPTGAGSIPDGGPDGRDAVRDSGQAREQRKGGGSGDRSGSGSGGRSGGPQAVRAPTGVLLSSSGEPDVPAPSQSLTGWDVAVADPTLQAGVRIPAGSQVSTGMSVTAKLPLTGTSAIGTGEWDFGAYGYVSVPLSSRLTAGLDASYWILGDLPDFEFQDPVTGSASLGLLFGNGWAGLASFTAGTSALEGYDAPLWIGAAVSRLRGNGALGLNLTVGLSETVPDLGLGLTWSIPIRTGSQ